MRCALLCLLSLMCLLGPATAGTEDNTETYSGTSNYIRGAYQWGAVLQTNDFLKGDNLSGTPIENFQSARIEFGWQTDGSSEWQHAYNFPSYGIGLYGADFYNDEELGQPTSLYGFFDWPFHRSSRWQLSFGLGFGLTTDWEAYDAVNNPKNMALGLGRSVHIEVGGYAEYKLARRWALIGGITGTHFSNGGTQRPNHGLNAMGPILFVKHHIEDPARLPTRVKPADFDRGWNLTLTGSVGKRNLDLVFDDPDLNQQYSNQSFFIGNITAVVGRKFSYMGRYCFGLDVCYDESVPTLVELEGYKNGQNVTADSMDKFDLAAIAGYEHIAKKTHVLVQLGYIFARKDVLDRLPRFYQRFGVKQFVWENWFAGLNVRFHELGSADNLEWNAGYVVGL